MIEAPPTTDIDALTPREAYLHGKYEECERFRAALFQIVQSHIFHNSVASMRGSGSIGPGSQVYYGYDLRTLGELLGYGVAATAGLFGLIGFFVVDGGVAAASLAIGVGGAVIGWLAGHMGQTKGRTE